MMQHEFDFRGAAEMPRPYDPANYGLPIWRDEDHQPQETVEQEPKTAEIMSAEEAKCKLCAWAISQVGYSEGPNNWQKYAENADLQAMYGWKPQNQPWCDVFVDSGFISCFGLENACKMTYQPMGRAVRSADSLRSITKITALSFKRLKSAIRCSSTALVI